jgi:hypothetical protein
MVHDEIAGINLQKNNHLIYNMPDTYKFLHMTTVSDTIVAEELADLSTEENTQRLGKEL